MRCQTFVKIQIISRSVCECYNSEIIPGFDNKESPYSTYGDALLADGYQSGGTNMGRKQGMDDMHCTLSSQLRVVQVSPLSWQEKKKGKKVCLCL